MVELKAVGARAPEHRLFTLLGKFHHCVSRRLDTLSLLEIKYYCSAWSVLDARAWGSDAGASEVLYTAGAV